MIWPGAAFRKIKLTCWKKQNSSPITHDDADIFNSPKSWSTFKTGPRPRVISRCRDLTADFAKSYNMARTPTKADQTIYLNPARDPEQEKIQIIACNSRDVESWMHGNCRYDRLNILEFRQNCGVCNFGGLTYAQTWSRICLQAIFCLSASRRSFFWSKTWFFLILDMVIFQNITFRHFFGFGAH